MLTILAITALICFFGLIGYVFGLDSYKKWLSKISLGVIIVGIGFPIGFLAYLSTIPVWIF